VSFVELFEDDWIYAGGKALSPPESSWSKTGAARCRIIPDGPDETLDSLALVLNGIIATAKRRVWIMTPYFLPDQKMTGCLQSAALSGVDVTVIIPQKNNWPVVQWALQHRMAELLETGVTIMQRPGLFAHSKCMIIDDTYCMTGSANLDPRSLRLNFELGIEIIDPTLNAELAAHFEQVADIGEPFTQEQLRQRNTLIRLRDAAAALFTPYL